jgi:hypothetical protein
LRKWAADDIVGLGLDREEKNAEKKSSICMRVSMEDSRTATPKSKMYSTEREREREEKKKSRC